MKVCNDAVKNRLKIFSLLTKGISFMEMAENKCITSVYKVLLTEYMSECNSLEQSTDINTWLKTKVGLTEESNV